MGFLGIYTAIYDYQPQSENELEIHEGELLYVLEKSAEDSWWKAKKRAADDDEEEPVGLIPNNYVEEAQPTHFAQALYDYSRQTDEEVSFPENANLDVYDASDPDWTLVGASGDYGFAPSNYIEIGEAVAGKSHSGSSAPQQEAEAEPEPTSSTESSPAVQSPAAQDPAASLARVMGGRAPAPLSATRSASSPMSTPGLPPRQQYTPEASEAEEPAPALPRRPPSQHVSPPANSYPSPQNDEPPGVQPSPPFNRAVQHTDEDNRSVPGGYRIYSLSEMVSAMGKRKKLPTTLGINLATGTVFLSPEKSRDGPTQEWTAEKLTHYSLEGKHVFMELVKPSKSLDLHAGSKDTANEIVSDLGEIAGAVRSEGIREVMAAATGSGQSQKKGQILYDFMAQGEDEVTVGVGDEVYVLDDKNSDEWWLVRRLKNGKEGVVPSSYVEEIGTLTIAPVSTTGVNAGRSTVEQNRLEEERLAKEAARSDRKRQERESKHAEVGPGMALPDRGSSLTPQDSDKKDKRNKRDSKAKGEASKPKPDPHKTRTWSDRSNTFKVEAQFIGLTDGKIHLHKVNGVKIAVPVSKMAVEDLEYVEQVTGISLDEDKPLSDIRRKSRSNGQAGASIERPKQPDYDWFDFFLKAGVGPHQCERYSQNFNKDSMDESVLPDITPEVLRTLGLKEGDILRVMKFLDTKYGRTAGAGSRLRSVSFAEDGEEGANGSAGGLFTGPGGTLRNNTRKGRPTPATQASDVVDPKAFDQPETAGKAPPAESKVTPIVSAPKPEPTQSGFDDDAWEVKRPKETAPTRPTAPPSQSTPAASGPPGQNSVLTGALAELSLLSPPLQPTPVAQPQAPPMIPQPLPQQQLQTAALPQQPQATGANPAFFSQLNQQQQQQQPGAPQQNFGQMQQLQGQQTGMAQQNFGQQPQMQPQQTSMPQQMPPRQRPQPPQNPSTSALIAPPPRPLSAPQNFQQQNQFGPPPLQPQLTGIPHTSPLQSPPGQSMNDLTQQRFQQQYGQPQMQPQQTGFPQQGPTPYSNGVMPQQTGFQQQPQPFGFQQQQQFLNGNQQGSPFADPGPGAFSPLSAQQTGFGGFPQSQQPMPSGVNARLPPALQPQQTGFQPQFQPQQTGFQPQFPPQQTGFQPQMQPQQTGMNGFGGQGFGQPPPPLPPMPPMPSQPTVAPLVAQKTGPAPPVRFGVQEAKKLAPQPTGRRANLSSATPQNPFGF